MPPFDQVTDRDKIDVGAHPCGRCQVGEVAFCTGLSSVDIQRLSTVVGQIQVPASTAVFREGEGAVHMYSVALGTLKLYKLMPDGRRQITAFLFPGDFFGLAVDGNYAYTAEALTPVVLCRFPRRKLDQVLEEVPRIEKRLLGLAIDELAAAHEQMLLLGRKTAREKVASFLLMLSRRAERRGLAPSPIALPMSRSDIADYLGLTIETVSRTLTQLKRDGVIGLPDTGHAVLSDAGELKRIAEGT
jgi:CRP/FNR family transcriptional regulator